MASIEQEENVNVLNIPKTHCLFCKQSDEKLIILEQKNWMTLRKAAGYRLLLKTDKYRSITTDKNLQEDFDNGYHYHSLCYKNYTAVKRSSTIMHSECTSAKVPCPETRSNSTLISTDGKGLMKGSCIFCPIKRKTVKGKFEQLSDCLTYDGCQSVFAAAEKTDNERIKSLVRAGVDLIASEAQYHKSCRRTFFNETEKNQPTSSKKTTSISSCRQQHAETFDVISNFIKTEVIDKLQAILATSLFSLYEAEYLSRGEQEDFNSYTLQALMKKVKEKFQEKLCVKVYTKRQGNFLYSSSMSEIEARTSLECDLQRTNLKNMIYMAALHLRSQIIKMPKLGTPESTTIYNLKPSIPEDLQLFYQTLLSGLQKPKDDENGYSLQLKVKSMSSDAVNNVSNNFK